jgi:hypothetical protein
MGIVLSEPMNEKSPGRHRGLSCSCGTKLGDQRSAPRSAYTVRADGASRPAGKRPPRPAGR